MPTRGIHLSHLNYSTGQVLSADRIQNSVDAVQSSYDSLDDVMSELETQVATLNATIQAQVANSSYLPVSGDFSNVASQNTVGVGVDDIGPQIEDPLANTILTAAANTILSMPFTAANTDSDFHYTIASNSSVETVVWISTTPGGNTLYYNTYLSDRAAAVKIEAGDEVTIRINQDDNEFANTEHIVTHWQMILDETYYLNITANKFGNFRGSRAYVDRQITAGSSNVAIVITGGSV